MVRPLLEQEPKHPLLAELRVLSGFPARITMENAGAPERTVKIPGVIRKVSVTGVTLDLLFPMTMPHIGAPVVLEVISRTALLQCFTAIQHTDNPQCIHLRLPDEVHTVQRRRSPRVDLAVLAAITETNGTAPSIAVQLQNLSAGGAAVRLDHPFDVGSRLILNLTATGLNPAEVHGEVVRCTPTPAGAWVVGLAFIDLTPTQVEQLNQFVDLVLTDAGL